MLFLGCCCYRSQQMEAAVLSEPRLALMLAIAYKASSFSIVVLVVLRARSKQSHEPEIFWCQCVTYDHTWPLESFRKLIYPQDAPFYIT